MGVFFIYLTNFSNMFSHAEGKVFIFLYYISNNYMLNLIRLSETTQQVYLCSQTTF